VGAPTEVRPARFFRSISGRVALGFFVGLATFGTVSSYTILRMRQLGTDLQFVRTAYLDLAFDITKLNEQQAGLLDSLEQQPPPSRSLVKYNLGKSEELLDSSIKDLSQFAGRWRVDANRARLETLREKFRAGDQLAEAAFAEQLSPEARAAAFDAFKKAERHLKIEIGTWSRSLKEEAMKIAMNLEEIERQASLGAIVLGALGATLGILVTVWVILTLRPLRRLHEAVRKVAGGNYRERVDTVGGTEVADLAREFNAMAAALSEREQELVRSERLAAVGKIAAVITHEVRNPLSSIGLNTELLEDEVAHASPEAVALCRSIGKEVDRLTAITEEYLRFARMPRPRREREDMNGLVAGVVTFVKEDLASRGVRIITDLSPDLGPVSLDEAQLRQALMNLIRNAADAMPGGGTLTIATRLDDDGAAVISVADSGPGIAPEDLARIFEPFFSTKDGGTGLGLALTQHIMKEHGGSIAVESAPGQGTTFRLSLPTST